MNQWIVSRKSCWDEWEWSLIGNVIEMEESERDYRQSTVKRQRLAGQGSFFGWESVDDLSSTNWAAKLDCHSRECTRHRGIREDPCSRLTGDEKNRWWSLMSVHLVHFGKWAVGMVAISDDLFVCRLIGFSQMNSLSLEFSIHFNLFPIQQWYRVLLPDHLMAIRCWLLSVKRTQMWTDGNTSEIEFEFLLRLMKSADWRESVECERLATFL
jgi:hypothetical protein